MLSTASVFLPNSTKSRSVHDIPFSLQFITPSPKIRAILATYAFPTSTHNLNISRGEANFSLPTGIFICLPLRSQYARLLCNTSGETTLQPQTGVPCTAGPASFPGGQLLLQNRDEKAQSFATRQSQPLGAAYSAPSRRGSAG